MICFFDPAHGQASVNVMWQPQWGVARPVEVCQFCAQRIQTTRYPALQRLTEFTRYDTGLPNAEQAAERHLALPLSAHTTLEQVERVSRAVSAALA